MAINIIQKGFTYKDKRRYDLYRCDNCGKDKLVRSDNTSRRCVCEGVKFRNSTGVNKKAYHIWTNMLKRCTNPAHPMYKYYGGKGVRVCESWLNWDNFFKDIGSKLDGYDKSIDRIDSNGNYEPSNCKVSTAKEQSWNRTSNVNFIDYLDEQLPLHPACKKAGISYDAVRKWKASKGITFQEAFNYYLTRKEV